MDDENFFLPLTFARNVTSIC